MNVWFLFLIAVIPKLLPFSFGEEPLNSGQVVTVPCAVTEGDPPLKLRWTLNAHAISPHSGIAVLDLGGRGAILSIGSVQAGHAGTYTCIAENPAGRHELSADLIVNGVLINNTLPSKPHFSLSYFNPMLSFYLKQFVAFIYYFLHPKYF